jgi:hypothetical protein
LVIVGASQPVQGRARNDNRRRARIRAPKWVGGVSVKAYRFLAFMIAVLVIVQATTIAWGFFGVGNFVDDGGVIDKEFLECTDDCQSVGSGDIGFAIHMFFNGLVLIPLTSLVLLIVSFFAKVPGGVKYAGIIFVLVVLQVLVWPALSREVGAGFGALHGLNAMVILGVAIAAGRKVSTPMETPATTSTTTV